MDLQNLHQSVILIDKLSRNEYLLKVNSFKVSLMYQVDLDLLTKWLNAVISLTLSRLESQLKIYRFKEWLTLVQINEIKQLYSLITSSTPFYQNLYLYCRIFLCCWEFLLSHFNLFSHFHLSLSLKNKLNQTWYDLQHQSPCRDYGHRLTWEQSKKALNLLWLDHHSCLSAPLGTHNTHSSDK